MNNTFQNGFVYIYYFDGKKNGACYLPNDFHIEILNSSDRDIFIKEYVNLQIIDLQENLTHTGTVGSTPKFFAESEDGKCIPAHLFLPDEKNCILTSGEPGDDNFGGNGGTKMYHENFNGSFATRSKSCLAWQIDSIAAGIHTMHNAMKKKFPDARLSIKSVMDISKNDIESSNEFSSLDIKKCTNAYGLKPKTISFHETYFRAVDAPIHLDVGKLNANTAVNIVKALDSILGVMCVSMFAQMDDPRRRLISGLPGDFRVTDTGLEYLALSNAWLCHPAISNLVIDLARKITVFGTKNFNSAWNASEEETISCMMEYDVSKSRMIMDRNKELISKIFKSAYNWVHKNNVRNYEWIDENTGFNFLYDIFYNGLQSLIKDPFDLVNNWNVNGQWVPHSDGPNKNMSLTYFNYVGADNKAKKYLI